jgi:hypothetical protein
LEGDIYGPAIYESGAIQLCYFSKLSRDTASRRYIVISLAFNNTPLTHAMDWAHRFVPTDTFPQLLQGMV